MAQVATEKCKVFDRGMPGVERSPDGELSFAEWSCRAGQNNVIVRTDGTVGPCFPMYASNFDWGNIDQPKFDHRQMGEMKKTCQKHCFSTLNHNLAYCYNDAARYQVDMDPR